MSEILDVRELIRDGLIEVLGPMLADLAATPVLHFAENPNIQEADLTLRIWLERTPEKKIVIRTNGWEWK